VLRRLFPLLVVCSLLLGACDVEQEVDEARTKLEQRTERLRRDAQREYRERRDKIKGRVQEYLAQLEQAIPEAEGTSPEVQVRGRNEPQEIDAFMEDVLRNIDSYWTRTLRASGLPEPSVSYEFLPPRAVRISGCGITAGGDAAFYCPADDTIYVSQRFAADLYEGVVDGLPGESAGYGRAAGDFAVAYVLAHEYAHNLQQELGLFDNSVGPTARPFELQADCWAGTWANSVFEQGELGREDLDEILNAALAVGDFDVGNETHHGTPEERRDAVLTGFESGDPAACRRYVPET
jgi:predicted metalloprotease